MLCLITEINNTANQKLYNLYCIDFPCKLSITNACVQSFAIILQTIIKFAGLHEKKSKNTAVDVQLSNEKQGHVQKSTVTPIRSV